MKILKHISVIVIECFVRELYLHVYIYNYFCCCKSYLHCIHLCSVSFIACVVLCSVFCLSVVCYLCVVSYCSITATG
jgi:hypothetical protein